MKRKTIGLILLAPIKVLGLPGVLVLGKLEGVSVKQILMEVFLE